MQWGTVASQTGDPYSGPWPGSTSRSLDLTDFHAKYLAYELTRRYASDSEEKLASAVAGAQVDLTPNQVDAALFAFHSPLSKGALLADEVEVARSLLVLCTAFRADPDAWPNLTVKKIPNQVLSRCEWDHDDYSLNVANLPAAPLEPGQIPLELDL